MIKANSYLDIVLHDPIFNNSDIQIRCAANDPSETFDDSVLNNPQAILDNPSITSNVRLVINSVHPVRCCDVLPDIDVIPQGTLTKSMCNLASSVPTTPYVQMSALR